MNFIYVISNFIIENKEDIEKCILIGNKLNLLEFKKKIKNFLINNDDIFRLKENGISTIYLNAKTNKFHYIIDTHHKKSIENNLPSILRDFIISEIKK